MALPEKNIAILEHVNLYVGSRDQCFTFYRDGLGFVPDPRVTEEGPGAIPDLIHMNCGLSQFHLPIVGRRDFHITQTIRGAVEILYSPEEFGELEQRLAKIKQGKMPELQIIQKKGANNCLEVVCPWGNTFRCVCVDGAAKLRAENEARGALPGAEAKGLGISKVEVLCPVGSAPKIATFYNKMLGADVSCENGTATIECGGWTSMAFVESAEFKELKGWTKDIGMDQWHVAVYLQDFEGAYSRILEQGVQWDNPRIKDYARTLEEAVGRAQFRFKDIRDLDTNETIMELEHEVRSMQHKSCLLGRTKADADAAVANGSDNMQRGNLGLAAADREKLGQMNNSKL